MGPKFACRYHSFGKNVLSGIQKFGAPCSKEPGDVMGLFGLLMGCFGILMGLTKATDHPSGACQKGRARACASGFRSQI